MADGAVPQSDVRGSGYRKRRAESALLTKSRPITRRAVGRALRGRKNRVGAGSLQWHDEPMSDYDRIAQVIRYLDERHTEQPDLATLAQQVGLGRFHFHRLFAAWAGITPKDFLQCLTLAHAKMLLLQGERVLDAALDAGLSGPGRLHDLCVSLEAASPGEIKAGGAGWTIVVGVADSPFGACLIGESPRGICHLSFVDSDESPGGLAGIRNEWPQACLQRDDAAAERLAQRLFAPRASRCAGPPMAVVVRGTAFQVRVWRALLQIPPGTLVSYGHLAALLGKPGAARTVGTAVARNPLAYLIPCHRVIRETGVVGEYRWGRTRKCAMVAWECSSRFDG